MDYLRHILNVMSALFLVQSKHVTGCHVKFMDNSSYDNIKEAWISVKDTLRQVPTYSRYLSNIYLAL